MHLLLPSESEATQAHAHLLAVEMRNRSETACHLERPVLDFRDDRPDSLSLHDQFLEERDTSATTEAFRQNKGILAPGATAHLLLAWSSAANTGQTYWQPCLNHDALMLGYNWPLKRPFFVAEHLWMTACEKEWRSDLRTGAFAPGEPVAAGWLAHWHLQRRDVAEPQPPHKGLQLVTHDTVTYLASRRPAKRGYFGFSEFFLQAGALAPCGLSTLWKREDDGQTAMALNHCDPAPDASALLRNTSHVTLLPRDFGMAPQRVGTVRYEATLAGPTGLAATLAVQVRDPDAPDLQTIDTMLQPCRADQLQLTHTDDLGTHWDKPRDYASNGKVWWRGRVFTFRNTSRTACLLGGVPDVDWTGPADNLAGQWSIAPCRNCDNALFARRDSHSIEVAPGQAAHLILSAQTVDASFPYACTVIGGLRLHLAADTRTDTLPFTTATCGQPDLSAWRSGAYDGKPLTTDPALPLVPGAAMPAACVSVLKQNPTFGSPVFFSSPSIQYGLSSPKPQRFRKASLLLWMANSTDHPITFATCSDRDAFLGNAFEILDRDGHRVLEPGEAEERARPDAFAAFRLGSVCTNNVVVSLEANTCSVGDASGVLSYLLPGHYHLVPRTPDGQAPSDAARKAHPLALQLPLEVLP